MGAGNGLLYIVPENDINARVEIQFIPPDLAFSRKPIISKIDIIGRNTPWYHYSGGSHAFTLQLDFYSEEITRQDVITKCKLIESWSANNGYNQPPTRIKVIWGDLLSKNNEWWVITGCDYRVSNFDKVANFLPRQAYMELALEQESDTQVMTKDIIFDNSDIGRPRFT